MNFPKKLILVYMALVLAGLGCGKKSEMNEDKLEQAPPTEQTEQTEQMEETETDVPEPAAVEETDGPGDDEKNDEHLDEGSEEAESEDDNAEKEDDEKEDSEEVD